MYDLLVCKNHKCRSIGSVWYNAVSDNVISEINSELEGLLFEDNDHFTIEPDDDNKPEVIDTLIDWIYSINRNNEIITKITYNWITTDDVVLEPDQSYYILTLTGDDYIGTYLSLNVGSWSTIKYTKSKDLYPDEREDNQHYYDGGVLIYIPNNSKLDEIKASNCLIFHMTPL